MSNSPVFYLDLGSPYAYLSAERIDDQLPGASWQVIALGGIFKATGRSSWGEGARRAGGQAEIARRAEVLGLPPVVWPEPWPNNGLAAARAAVWAGEQGRERAFALEVLRLQFRDGRPASDPNALTEALRRADLDPAAALAAISTPEIKLALRERTDAALARGVFGVPSFAVDQFVLWGDDQLELAAQLAGGADKR